MTGCIIRALTPEPLGRRLLHTNYVQRVVVAALQMFDHVGLQNDSCYHVYVRRIFVASISSVL